MLTYLLDDDSKSMYVQLYERLRNDIERGWIRPGQRLPSKREFAEHLEVSPITVQHAYDKLMDEGYIESIPKSGYFALGVGNTHSIIEDVVASPADIIQEDSAQPSGISLGQGQHRQSVSASDKKAINLKPKPLPLAWSPATNWMTHLRKIVKESSDVNCVRAEQTFLHVLVQNVAKTRHLKATADQILVASNMNELFRRLSLILSAQIHSKATPAKENVTWYVEGLTKSLAQDLRAYNIDAQAAKTDQRGLDPALLADDANIIICRPSHAYPTATTMPIRRKNEILDWVDASPSHYVVEDDQPALLRFSELAIPPLYIQDPNHVILVSSYGFGPLFSCAYAIVPHKLAHRARSAFGNAFFESAIAKTQLLSAAAFISNGDYDRYQGRLKKQYEASYQAFIRMVTMLTGAKREIGSDSSKRAQTLLTPRIIGAQNAPYFVIQFPKQYDLGSIIDMLKEKQIDVATTRQLEGIRESSQCQSLVIDLTGIDKESARNAAATLCDVLVAPQALKK